MSRRDNRIFGMQIIYRVDFDDVSTSEAIKQVFNNDDFNEEGVEFALKYLNNREKVDQIIEMALENYSISRLNAVDRAIIRLATAEMYLGEDKE